MTLNLQRVTTFVTIVDSGGVSAASRKLGVAQSTVSTALQQLEREVGAPLIDRGSRALRLTEAGRTLLEYGRSLALMAAEALDRVARIRDAPVAGILQIGGTTTAAQRALPAALASFLTRYPDVDVAMSVGSTTEIIQQVLSGELPLALVAGTTEHPALESVHVADEEQLVLVAGSHLLAHQDVDPHSLRGTRVLLREEGSATREYQLALLDAWRIPAAQTSTIASTSAILSAVAHGLGIACLPRAVAEPSMRVGAVAEIRFEVAPPLRPVSLVRRTDRPLTLIEELFLTRIREEGIST